MISWRRGFVALVLCSGARVGGVTRVVGRVEMSAPARPAAQSLQWPLSPEANSCSDGSNRSADRKVGRRTLPFVRRPQH